MSEWSEIRTLYVLETIRLLAGSTIEKSTLAVRNKIFARIRDTAIVETAVYDSAGDPLRYSATRREDTVIMPAGDSTAAQVVANLTVARRRQEQEYYSGLQVALEDGLKLQRGELVGVLIDRLDVSATLPIRELVFDVGAGVCQVTVGSWAASQTDLDTLVSIAERVDRIERENA